MAEILVTLVAGVLKGPDGHPSHREFAFPGLGIGCRIRHFKAVENRIRVEQAEAFHNVHVAVPAIHSPGIPIEAARIIEVGGVHDERCAFPVPH